ncbi:ATP-grasp domain-containing protein [Salmonella enterica]
MSSIFAEQKPVVIIINGISSGVLLTEELLGHFMLIHIESDAAIESPKASGFNRENFDVCLLWDPRKKEQIIAELRAFDPIAVIPGSESAVELSEKLARYLDIEGNDPHTTALRRNKYQMNEAVRRAGLRVTAHYTSDDPLALRTWFTQHGGRKVVVKPLASAGSDDVYICTRPEEVEKAARIIDGKKNNVVYQDNQQALIQRFIEGTEYIINTVSLRGRHKITDIWRVTKRLVDGRSLYDFDDLCDPGSSDARMCIDYTLKLLPVIGLVKGAGHTELILSAEGPTLLEVGARASSSANPKAIRQVTNGDQLRLMRYAYTNTLAFKMSQDIYRLKQPLRCVHAIASHPHAFSLHLYQEFLNQLPGFVNVMMNKTNNALLTPTVDNATCPAVFFLTGRTQREIDDNYLRYREWEAVNL